jgi:hypothetical protein
VEDIEEIKEVAINYYKKLLGTSQMKFTNEKAVMIKSLIPIAISTDKADLLVREVTYEEIRDTMFHMPANKAPNPDGYTSEFFKTSWSIVGEDVMATGKGVFFFFFFFFIILFCCLKK